MAETLGLQILWNYHHISQLRICNPRQLFWHWNVLIQDPGTLRKRSMLKKGEFGVKNHQVVVWKYLKIKCFDVFLLSSCQYQELLDIEGKTGLSPSWREKKVWFQILDLPMMFFPLFLFVHIKTVQGSQTAVGNISILHNEECARDACLFRLSRYLVVTCTDRPITGYHNPIN